MKKKITVPVFPAVVILAVVAVIVFLMLSNKSDTALDEPRPPAVLPSSVDAAVSQMEAQTPAPADQAEAVPDVTNEGIETEPAEEAQPVQPEPGVHEHDNPAAAAAPLSPEVVEAIREIRKPEPGDGQVIEHSDGSAEMKAGNRFRSVPVATIGKDGKVQVDYHGEARVPDEKASTATEKNNASAQGEHTP
jgi:hypothetical protein